jgi:hypothetical protein
MNLKRHWRKLADAVLIMSLGVLAATQLGSSSPPDARPGFSSSAWNGSSGSNSLYAFGILDAATDIGPNPSAFCDQSNPPAATNSAFSGGAYQLVKAEHKELDAFWWLTSNYFATNVCHFNYTPSDWGVRQAVNFMNAVSPYGAYGFIQYWFGDVECGGCNCFTSGSDWGWWTCGDVTTRRADNRQVILGFETALAYVGISKRGVYSSESKYPPIVGDNISASVLNAPYMWLASYNPDQSQLSEQAHFFNNLGYAISSWQYAENCEMTEVNAHQLAIDVGVSLIPRFDSWMNATPPDHVCGQ